MGRGSWLKEALAQESRATVLIVPLLEGPGDRAGGDGASMFHHRGVQNPYLAQMCYGNVLLPPAPSPCSKLLPQ